MFMCWGSKNLRLGSPPGTQGLILVSHTFQSLFHNFKPGISLVPSAGPAAHQPIHHNLPQHYSLPHTYSSPLPSASSRSPAFPDSHTYETYTNHSSPSASCLPSTRKDNPHVFHSPCYHCTTRRMAASRLSATYLQMLWYSTSFRTQLVRCELGVMLDMDRLRGNRLVGLRTCAIGGRGCQRSCRPNRRGSDG